MSDRTVAKEVVETLRDLGVKHVFGVPSGGWVDYMEAIRTTDGIEFVLATHEGGAGFMADVTGRLTGVPGVCFGTFGPGATNLATGVGNALLDRSPMIALTDEMADPMRGRVVQMGIDHQALFEPLTKKTTRLTSENVSQQLAEAAKIAVSDRPGPVHVGLPVGMSAQSTEHEAQKPVSPAAQPNASEEALAALEEHFRAARKPVLAVGLGAAQAGLGEQVKEIAEKFGIPVLLTPMAKGMIPEGHPCYAGVFFHALSDAVGETHAEADLVVAIGYDPVEFNFESWMRPECPLVNIDIVPVDIDRSKYTVAVDVTGDLSNSLARLASLDCERKGWELSAVQERMATIFERMRPNSQNFGPCAALEVLREVLPEYGIMACDVGAHTHLIGQKWPTPEFGLQIMTNGWSAMGFGLPAAIAAKLCRPEKPVCCVVGDGGFLMTAGEIATAVREKLPIVILVLTDNDLALIRIKQERKDNPIYGTPVRAEGTIGGSSLFGAPVVTASTPEELEKALRDGFEADGPVIVEALIDSREYDDLVLRKDKP
jgi:acetolactate synthase-1/2/3 large subunit